MKKNKKDRKLIKIAVFLLFSFSLWMFNEHLYIENPIELIVRKRYIKENSRKQKRYAR